MARLVFVTGSLAPGGAERHAIALMGRLAERGHQCHAVGVKGMAGPGTRLRPRGGGRPRHAGPRRSLKARRYLDLRALRDFAAQLSRIDPSAIVAANPYALMYSWLALRLARLRAPLMVTYHSNRLLGTKERLQMMLYRLFFRTAACSVFV